MTKNQKDLRKCKFRLARTIGKNKLAIEIFKTIWHATNRIFWFGEIK